MDGHSSHFSSEMIRMDAEEQVILFVLPHPTQLKSLPLKQTGKKCVTTS